jgi:hypothetical protein
MEPFSATHGAWLSVVFLGQLRYQGFPEDSRCLTRRWLSERRIGRENNPLCLAVFVELSLGKVNMALNLARSSAWQVIGLRLFLENHLVYRGHDLGILQQNLQVLDAEVRDANGPALVPHELLHLLPRLGHSGRLSVRDGLAGLRVAGLGPVHQLRSLARSLPQWLT